jgi:hypothetical protein
LLDGHSLGSLTVKYRLLGTGRGRDQQSYERRDAKGDDLDARRLPREGVLATQVGEGVGALKLDDGRF